MSEDGYVEINRHETAAKCGKCGKSIAYQLPMSLAMWNEILKAFVRRHRACGE